MFLIVVGALIPLVVTTGRGALRCFQLLLDVRVPLSLVAREFEAVSEMSGIEFTEEAIDWRWASLQDCAVVSDLMLRAMLLFPSVAP